MPTCATVAEWQLGAGQGASDLILVTLGTGIGGGLVADGVLHRGRNGFAGEYGHMVVQPNGPRCPLWPPRVLGALRVRLRASDARP